MQMAGSLINQLVQLHGRKISETVILFPKAKVLANADLTALKTTNARKQTIKDVSKKFESQEISAAHYATPKIFREKILQIKGIGP